MQDMRQDMLDDQQRAEREAFRQQMLDMDAQRAAPDDAAPEPVSRSAQSRPTIADMARSGLMGPQVRFAANLGRREIAGAVVDDVSRGLIEAPSAVWHGFADAVNETLNLADEVQTQMATAVSQAMGQDLSPEAIELLISSGVYGVTSQAIADPQARLATGEEPESQTGQIVESMAQFLTGFIGAGKVRAGANVLRQAPAVLRSGVDSALASFTVFDGHEARLADLVESVPELSNPVTQFLQSNEDDPELVGRLKNALEDIGTGGLADAFVAGLRSMRGARQARQVGQDIVLDETRLDESAAREMRDFIRISGDPQAAPIQIVSEPGRLTQDMLSRTAMDIEAGVQVGPQEAEALVGAAERWAAAVARQQPEQARRFEDLAQEWRERGDPETVRSLVAAMDEVRAPAEEPPSLMAFLNERGGILDEGGELGVRDLARNTEALNRFTRTRDRQTLDDAALAAWEAGYFPGFESRPTPRDLLDAIDRDARALSADDIGGRVYSINDDEAVARVSARRQLVDELDRMEVDYTDPDPARRAQGAADAAAETAAQRGDTMTEADLISINQAMEAAAARGGISAPTAELLGANDVRINFNALNTSDDIRSIIGQLADAFSGEITAARGGVRGNATLFAEQSDLGNAWGILERRRQGQPLTDAEVIAAQRLYIASAENVRRAAQMVIEPGARRGVEVSDDMLQFNLRRAMGVHRAIQAEIAGAKADAGRALRAWQVVTGTTNRARAQLLSVLDSYGGAITREQASRLAQMGAEELDRTVRYTSAREVWSTVGADVLRFLWLSGPPTHLMNMAGNTLTTVYDTLPRLTAGVKGKLLGDPELEMQLGSALAQYAGLRAGLAAQFRAFARSADYGRMGKRLAEAHNARSMREYLESSAAAVWEDNPLAATWRARFDDMGVSGRKFEDGANPRSVSAERFGVNGDTVQGRLLNGIGRVLSAPTDFLGYQDDFFKGVNEVSERHALAYEAAARELNAGEISREQFAERYRRHVEYPSPEITEKARAAAQRRTFTEPVGDATRSVLKLRQSMNAVVGAPLGHLLLPFVVTPSNILKFAFQSSPGGVFFREVQDDLAAGGARRATAQARIAAGTGLLMYGMDLAMKGQITGAAPTDPGAREAWDRMGIQEYSIRIGDKWVSYRRLEPVSTMLAIGADLSQIAHNVALDDDPVFDAGELLGPALGAALGVVTSKTYLTGISELIQFAEDPQRYGTSYIERLASSLAVPVGLSQIERAVDPEIRAAHNAITQIQSRLPGFSDELPQQYDLWGRPRVFESGVSRAYDALSPFTIRTQDPEPIDSELYRLGSFERRPSPRFAVPYGGVNVEVNLRNSPEIYQRYVQLAGNEARIFDGMGAKDYLNAVVSGSHAHSLLYSQLSDVNGARNSKAEFISARINDARQAARNQVIQEFRPQLMEIARRNLEAQAQAAELRAERGGLLDP